MDSLRGLAIVTMVCANMADLLGTSPPIAFRLYGSFAAPTFITLAGFFVARSVSMGKIQFIYFLRRSALLLATAAAVDAFCYGIMPFVQVDVLYLIGVGTPLAFLLAKSHERWAFVAVLVIFALAPLLRFWLGYSPELYGLLLNGSLYAEPAGAAVWKHWLIDGWFPLFPWLGFLCFGVVLERISARDSQWFAAAGCRNLALGFIGAAVLGYQISPSPMLIRVGYSEIFYPPSTNFIVLALGVILCGAWLASATSQWRAWRWVRSLGRASLFFYVLHLVLIAKVLKPVFSPLSLGPYLLLYFALMLFLLATAYGIQLSKAKFSWMRGYLGRFYFGT